MARASFRAAAARIRHHCRSRSTAPGSTLAPAPYLCGRALGLIAVVVFGAWLGLLVVGSVRTPVGPMDTTMALRPSLSGGTKIDVAPLGALELDSHIAPVRLDVQVARLDPVRSGALVQHSDPPPAGLGRDHTRRARPDNGRGQPPSAGGEPTRSDPFAYSVWLTPKRRSTVSDVPKGAGQGLTVPKPQRLKKKRNLLGGSGVTCF